MRTEIYLVSHERGLIIVVLVSFWSRFGADAIGDLADRYMLQNRIATLVPLMLAILCGLAATSPMGELDDAAGNLVLRTHWVVYIGTAIVVVGTLLLAGCLWELSNAGPVMARNFIGWIGLVALSQARLGESRGWILAVAWAGLAIYAGENIRHEIEDWAWSMQPVDNTMSWLIMLILFAAGCFDLIRTPFMMKEN